MFWFSQIRFSCQKAIHREKFLDEFSIGEKGVFSRLRGKSIAIVGNARSLERHSYGSDIDAHDIVIRLNDAPIISPSSHGSRTDWMAVAKHISKQTLKARNPSLLLWMPAHRKRLDYRMATFSTFFLNSLERNDDLKRELGASSSVGCKVIDLVQSSNADKVTLCGFDFFASLSLSGNRTAEQVPHDFSAEKRMVDTILESDKRFSIRKC